MSNLIKKKIIFGSMRMLESQFSEDEWIDFFKFLFNKGINKIHISREYESYKLIKKIFTNKKFLKIKAKAKIILKCSSPNFKQKKFSEKYLIHQIKKCKQDLKIKRFYGIQWMWRGNLSDESMRLKNLNLDAQNINKAIIKIKKKYAKFFFCFPYTKNFFLLSEKIIKIDAFTVYYNIKEKNYEKLINSNNYKFLTIRPFIKITKKKKISYYSKILKNILSKTSIIGIMISLSKKKHIDQILKIKT